MIEIKGKINEEERDEEDKEKEPGVAFHFLFFPTFISIDY